MALKKYRFVVGLCGPTIIYSNIIRAEDKRAAVIAYLSEIEEELTEENITEHLRFVREVIPKANPDKLLDYMGKEIAKGDDVMFIRNKFGEAPRLVPGKVDSVTGKSVVIIAQNGERNRLVLSKDEPESITRVLVMTSRPERASKTITDATGYPIEDGDLIAYMKPIYYSRCDGFQTGKITKIEDKYVVVNGTKRAFERFVVLNG